MQFIDLGAQRERIRDRLKVAIDRVVEEGRYILGPQVTEFENKLAAYIGTKHVVACANGTDALLLPLFAAGVGPGDAVFVPSFTFAATAEVVFAASLTIEHAKAFYADLKGRMPAYGRDPDSLKVMPGISINSTRPSKSRVRTTLLPPPSTSTGRPCTRGSASAAGMSSGVRTCAA